jgi:hypothetical protein
MKGLVCGHAAAERGAADDPATAANMTTTTVIVPAAAIQRPRLRGPQRVAADPQSTM